MKRTSLAAFALVAALASADCLALPSTAEVTQIILAAGYSKSEAQIVDTDEVRNLAREFDGLNAKQWQEQSIIKFGGKCMVRIHFIKGSEGGFTVYAYPDRLYWSPQGRTNPYKYIAIGPDSLPVFRKRAASLLQAGRCAW